MSIKQKARCNSQLCLLDLSVTAGDAGGTSAHQCLLGSPPNVESLHGECGHCGEESKEELIYNGMRA